MPSPTILGRCRAWYLAGISVGCLVSLVADRAEGATPAWVSQLVRKIPRTEAELKAAFEKSKNSSVQVGVDEPLETPNFEGETSYDVTIAGKKESLKFAYSRLGIISYGMEVAPADQENLPSVSKNRILTRVNGDYISLQIRVHRDLATGAVYLYYKPFAAVGSYAGGQTQEFAPLMEGSVRDMKGMGLFVKPGAKIDADSLRTFVAVNLTTVVEEGHEQEPNPPTKPHYELQFVRARVDGDAVTLHTIVTNEYVGRFHYLKPYRTPTSRAECDASSVMFFTEYSAAKQSPSAKALRSTTFNSRVSFTLSELNEHAVSAGWQGDALDNLTDTLDAIIDGKIKSK